ncbi:MAG: beta-ketoacyl-ACP synthase III [Proteobacteria bacterium]|nr:MAG: beta-ketoacyl-ACP synthase III [Pseudomonadota bacterium]PIE40113.1 MAG: beta-ketoacyl-ACP synthase III [Gammaproteobacteria bacterium]
MKVAISGTGLYTPNQSISNDELVESFNAWVDMFNAEHADEIEAGKVAPKQKSSSEFIEKASGIKSRYVIDKSGILDPERMVPIIPERPDDEAGLQCEMSVVAARQALEEAGKTSDDVDAVIVACSNLERPYPAVAVEVQQALGIDGFGYDMNVACSSATFGLQAAVNAVQTGQARAVLVISPEICTGHLNFRDRDSHFIFGDACTAVLVEALSEAKPESSFEVVSARLKTRYSNMIRNNFGFLNRADESRQGLPDKLFVQQGRKVFKEVVPLVASMMSRHLAECELAPSDIKRMWLHQANLSMNLLISKKVLGREATREESPVILDTYANTSSAGSVIAFHHYKSDFREGDIGVLCSFGAGYSAGSVILRKC